MNDQSPGINHGKWHVSALSWLWSLIAGLVMTTLLISLLLGFGVGIGPGSLFVMLAMIAVWVLIGIFVFWKTLVPGFRFEGSHFVGPILPMRTPLKIPLISIRSFSTTRGKNRIILHAAPGTLSLNFADDHDRAQALVTLLLANNISGGEARSESEKEYIPPY